MMRTRFMLLILVTLLLSLGVTTAQSDLPTRDDLTANWTWIEPGGDTICAHGTPYGFEAREGSSDNLLVFFEGGGACWDSMTCTPDSRTFKHSVEENYTSNRAKQGIWDFENPENPFADWDIVFIGYCTGDVHMGDNTVEYGAETVYHKGFVNASAALDWTYDTFTDPSRVMIVGESAGALGSSFHAAYIMEHYQDAPVTLLADSFGGARGSYGDLIETWGVLKHLPDWMPELNGITADTLTTTMLFTATAQHYPENMFAQYNTVKDTVQTLFLAALELDPLAQGLPTNRDEIAATVPNFRAYTAGGSQHTIAGTPEFYTYAVSGVRVRDWFAALANGEDVDNVQCNPCDVAEVVQP